MYSDLPNGFAGVGRVRSRVPERHLRARRIALVSDSVGMDAAVGAGRVQQGKAHRTEGMNLAARGLIATRALTSAGRTPSAVSA
jgi:hypothetical protein